MKSSTFELGLDFQLNVTTAFNCSPVGCLLFDVIELNYGFLPFNKTAFGVAGLGCWTIWY